MLSEDQKFYICEKAYKPEEVNLSGVFSLGYFISEQIFNLNGKSKFEDIKSSEEKEKFVEFFKYKLKDPDDFKDYHLQSLKIHYKEDDEFIRFVMPDQTIYLVDGVELDYNNLKSKDLITKIDKDCIIILKDGIIKSFDSLSKDNNTKFVPNCGWLYLLGSFLYKRTFENLENDNIIPNGIWVENLIYSCIFYVLSGNKHYPDKLMRFIGDYRFGICISRRYYEFFNSIKDIVEIIMSPEFQAINFTDQLELVEKMVIIKELKVFLEF